MRILAASPSLLNAVWVVNSEKHARLRQINTTCFMSVRDLLSIITSVRIFQPWPCPFTPPFVGQALQECGEVHSLKTKIT